jgi:hypothetical protein
MHVTRTMSTGVLATLVILPLATIGVTATSVAMSVPAGASPTPLTIACAWILRAEKWGFMPVSSKPYCGTDYPGTSTRTSS